MSIQYLIGIRIGNSDLAAAQPGALLAETFRPDRLYLNRDHRGAGERDRPVYPGGVRVVAQDEIEAAESFRFLLDDARLSPSHDAPRPYGEIACRYGGDDRKAAVGRETDPRVGANEGDLGPLGAPCTQILHSSTPKVTGMT